MIWASVSGSSFQIICIKAHDFRDQNTTQLSIKALFSFYHLIFLIAKQSIDILCRHVNGMHLFKVLCIFSLFTFVYIIYQNFCCHLYNYQIIPPNQLINRCTNWIQFQFNYISADMKKIPAYNAMQCNENLKQLYIVKNVLQKHLRKMLSY